MAETIPCPVQRSKAYMGEFLSGPMCGRCFICALGSEEILNMLECIISGHGTSQDVSAIRWIAESMVIGSLCKRGKETGTFVLACVASHGFADHIDGNCPTTTCSAFYEYHILAERCISCGVCKNVCKTNAIFGLKRKNEWETGNCSFYIRQKRCVKSGACQEVCPEQAIVRVNTKTGQTITV